MKAIRAEHKKKSAHKKRNVAASSTEEEKNKKTASDDARSQFGRNAYEKAKKKWLIGGDTLDVRVVIDKLFYLSTNSPYRCVSGVKTTRYVSACLYTCRTISSSDRISQHSCKYSDLDSYADTCCL